MLTFFGLAFSLSWISWSNQFVQFNKILLQLFGSKVGIFHFVFVPFWVKKKKEPLLADYLSILHSSIEPEIDILQCSSHRDRSIHTITMISIVKVQRQWAVAVVIAKWLSKRLVTKRLWVLGYFSSTFYPLINVSFRRSLVIVQHNWFIK